uniref:Phosphatidylethanolamine binding protein 4 n=1 Tax=Leptobrachium leishanense TaxID=445787 RepID=A0A8C5QRC1_9ANUR
MGLGVKMLPLLFFHLPVLQLLSVSIVESKDCVYQTLIGDDANLCSKDLQIIYPDVGDVSCMYIPDCSEYPERLSKVWGPPVIRYSNAYVELEYILLMVDPDVPSRSDPKNKYWRHWAVTHIPGRELLNGLPMTGNILSAYRRPTPPPFTEYHRYQFLLYLQPIGLSPSLYSAEESPGSWNIDDFVSRFHLGFPVVTTQYMAKNIKQ